MDATTSRLVEFAGSARFDALSTSCLHACKQRLIDTVGGAFGAYHERLSVMSRAVAQRAAANTGARIWGSPDVVAPEAAAFANGVMLRLLDISDTYLGKSRGHPSDVLAAVLAVAEMTRSGGMSMLAAMALAYDIYCSFCDSVDINSQGFDQPVYASLASAIAAAKLMRLSDRQMENTIALTLTPNLALYRARSGELSDWKGCAAANAARNGVFAALLARDGFTGPTDVFEGKGGFWDLVGQFEWILPAADQAYKVQQTHLKRFPVCYHGQAAVEAALALRERVDLNSIRRIEVETFHHSARVMGQDPSRWAPANRETADHSLPYVIGTAMVDGVVGIGSFTDQKLHSPSVAELMRKVEVREDAEFSARFPQWAASRIKLTTASGDVLVEEVHCPQGHANSPMSDSDIEAKFRDLFSTFGPAEQAERVLNELWKIERSVDLGQALSCLVP